MYIFLFNCFGRPMFIDLRDPNAEFVILEFVAATNNLQLLQFH